MAWVGDAKLTTAHSERMVLPLWRSLHSLNLMLPKEDRKAMLLRLFNEDTPLMDHSKDRFHNKPESSTHPSTKVKDEPDGIKDEEEEEEEEEDAHAVIKDEIVVKGEGEVGDVAAAGLGRNVEAVEDGAGDGEREDDVLPDSLKEEEEDGDGE